MIDRIKITISTLSATPFPIFINGGFIFLKDTVIPVFPDAYKKIIDDTLRLAEKYNFDVCFEKKSRTFACEGDIAAIGYFDPANRRMMVCLTGEWLETFIHESCHMDQYCRDRQLWDSLAKSVVKYNKWTDGKIRLSDGELYAAIQSVITLELDCEKRAVKKIKKYKLPVNIAEYKQRVNTYLYNYIKFIKTRKWIDHHNKKEVYSLAPVRFQKHYRTIPQNLSEAMDKHTHC